MQGVTFQPNFLQQQQQQFQAYILQQQQQSTQMCCHQRQLIPKSKTLLKARKSQRVQTLREYVAVESPILSMPMATKFDQRKKIKKLVKTKEINIII
jgi:hypothetical protein